MSLVLVAISLTAMAGVGALAVDLGMLYKARADALRAAEAGALAGASVFLDFAPTAATAEARARELAEANSILNSPVNPNEVEVTSDMGAERVRVRIIRSGIGTWFARALGENSVQVGAAAAAGVTEASGANCVTPIMIPDAWADDTENPLLPWEDQIENWSFGNGDSYGAFDRPGAQSGYGSDRRNSFPDDYTNDYGRPITLRPQSGPGPGPDPQAGQNLGPGAYRLWTYQDEDPEIAERTTQCDARQVSLGGNNQYEVVPGETLPLGDLNNLITDDPGTSWDAAGGPGQGKMQSTSYSDWRQSPRVIKIALYGPEQMQSGDVIFNNIVLLFLESVDQSQNAITGRLLYYSGGSDDDGEAGALVKRVKLVE